MKFCKLMIVFVLCSLGWQTSYASFSWFGGPPSFSQFIQDVAREALRKGISARTLQLALHNIQPVNFCRPIPKNARRMGPGFRGYLEFAVTSSKILHGRQRLHENRALIYKIAHQYHVSPSVMVALWGLETDYGRLQGEFPEVAALATLAYSSHRPRLFRYELFAALKVLDLGLANVNNMKGSWAGAMGQCQFLPAEYLAYAVDYDHSGQRDIWNNKADVFATMANYLRYLGWNDQHGLIVPVRLPRHFYHHWLGLSNTKSVAAWNKYGVRDMAGHALPRGNAKTAIISPMGENSQSYLIYLDNYRAVYRWNHSSYYVLSVGLLANQIRG